MQTRSFGAAPWFGAIPWTRALAWSGVIASSGEAQLRLRPTVTARTERTNHDNPLDWHQNTRRAGGSVRHRDSLPGAADMGTSGLRTLHRNVLSRSVGSTA